MVTDLVKNKVKKVVRKKAIERRKVWKLKEDATKARFEGRIEELVSTGTQHLWKCFKKGVLKACDEVCGKKKGRREQGDIWWWNEDVKEAIARNKDVHKEMCKSGTQPNKTKYKNMKNRARKVAAKQCRRLSGS